MSHVFSPFIQTGDILHVQLDEFGGVRPTLVPVGADQDPHIRFCRDIAMSHRLFSIVPDNEKIGIFVKGDNRSVEELLDTAEDICRDLGDIIERKDDYKALYVQVEDLFALDAALAKAEREYEGYGFIAPSSTYHRFISGLDGDKMSSSRPNYALFLTDTPEEAKKKLWGAKTGGCQSADEQRKLGGNPDDCNIYELFTYGLIEDDKELTEIYRDCKEGNILCGNCKQNAFAYLTAFLNDLKEKRENAKEMIKEYL
jgi:tryptophanyl-tRNA synthetase